MLRATLRSGDHILLAPIYDAGGTANRTIRSEDLVEQLRAAGVDAELASTRGDAARRIAAAARHGDRAVVMGARDDTLPPSRTRYCRRSSRGRVRKPPRPAPSASPTQRSPNVPGSDARSHRVARSLRLFLARGSRPREGPRPRARRHADSAQAERGQVETERDARTLVRTAERGDRREALNVDRFSRTERAPRQIRRQVGA
jgi:hypothetical protein